MATETHRQGTAAEGIRIFDALLPAPGTGRVLDLGCGERHQTRHRADTIWVDLDEAFAADPRVLLLDVREAPHALRRMRFTAVLLTDVIEHLAKDDGWSLLRALESMADRILLFTPLGDLWVGSLGDRPPDSPHVHRSGWTPADLEPCGYTCWSWPIFHRFGDSIHGAFFAWKWTVGNAPSAESVARDSGVPIACPVANPPQKA
jgi:hypothetical protein